MSNMDMLWYKHYKSYVRMTRILIMRYDDLRYCYSNILSHHISWSWKPLKHVLPTQKFHWILAVFPHFFFPFFIEKNIPTFKILCICRHRKNFWAFTWPRLDFGLILLISSMIIHRSFTGPTHLLSANAWGPVSFAVSVFDGPGKHH